MLRAALGALTVLFLLQFPVGVLDVAISGHKQELREREIHQALASGESAVVLENYYAYTPYGVNFVMSLDDPEAGPNINIADYYGIDQVLGAEPEMEEEFQGW